MKKLFVLLAFWLAGSAFAQETILLASTKWSPTHVTLHIANTYSQYNNRLQHSTPGLGLKWVDKNGNGPALGAYQNGLGKTTAYAGYSWGWHLSGPFVAGLMVGAYKSAPRPGLHPFVVPAVGLALNDATTLKLSYSVKDCARCVQTLHLSLDFRWPLGQAR
jgi:hypothetical protein